MSEKLISNDNIMIKSDLEKLNQSELINLLLNQDKMLRQLLQEKQQKPIAKPRAMKPVPPPRKNVQHMVEYHEKINSERPKPLPRNNQKSAIEQTMQKTNTPVPKPRTLKNLKPVPIPRTVIKQMKCEIQQRSIKAIAINKISC